MNRAAPLVFFLASLLLRGTILAWAADTPLAFDERDYAAQAEGWAEVGAALLAGAEPSPSARDAAWGAGRWPPLFPIVLAPGAALGGVLGMRAVAVLLGALTTAGVWVATRRTVGERAAHAAALWHLLSPAWALGAHLLWSEALLCALVPPLVLAGYAAAARPERGPSARLGALLGLAALTRLAAWPWLIAVPLWLARRTDRREAGAWALVAGLLLLAPWQAGVAWRHGLEALPATSSAVSFAHGNHPGVPAGMGSSHGHAEGAARLEAAIAEERAQSGLSRVSAARAVAWREVQRDPRLAAERAARRLAEAWAPDWLALRHLLSGRWPQVPLAVAAAFWASAWAAWLAGLVLAAVGSSLGPAQRPLPWVLVGAGMLAVVPTLAMSRLHDPWMVALLPAIGLALTTPWGKAGRAAAVLGLAFALLVAALTVPGVIAVHLQPDPHYAPLVPRASW